MKSLGEQIRYYRKKKGWTLEELSDRAGVDIGTISALEARKSNRSQFTAALAHAFGMSTDQLMDTAHDWMDRANEPLTASEPPPAAPASVRHHGHRRWLFSPELYDAVVGLGDKDKLRLENLMRTSLDMPTLSTAVASDGKRKAA